MTSSAPDRHAENDPVRPDLVYVTPLMPRAAGNGLAMRAAAILQALAQRFAVHLFVVPVAGAAGPADAFVQRHTVRSAILDPGQTLDPLFALIDSITDPEERARRVMTYPKPLLSRFATGEAAYRLHAWSQEARPHAVHVMRLYLAPLVEPFLRSRPPHRPSCVLDLDDDEVISHERLAALYAAVGNASAAATTRAEARKFRDLAERAFPAFDRVCVCSAQDAHRLAAAHPNARFAVVPNSVEQRPRVARAPRGDTLRLLFVGTLGYFPNADAARFLCHEMLPILRRLTDRRIAIDLAGAGDISALHALAGIPEVTVHGYRDDLTPLYAAADVAVVPLRSGGGTRIKILEAFALGVPVVATSIAAEGIAAEHRRHLLIADGAEELASACLSIWRDREQMLRQVEAAAQLAATKYGPEQVRHSVTAVYDDLVFTGKLHA